jgi:voltage-gated sodium channel
VQSHKEISRQCSPDQQFELCASITSEQSLSPIRTEYSDAASRASSKASECRRRSFFSQASQEFKQFKQIGWIHKLATSQAFEVTFAFLILASSVLLAAECQFQGHNFGYEIDYDGFDKSAKDQYPGFQSIFLVLDVALGVSFTLEVLLKLYAHGLRFARDAWNVFDTLIVVAWLITAFADKLVSMPADPTIFRMARLARLLRLMKLIKTLSGLDNLFLMTTVLKGSMNVLVWALVLMLALQTMAAFLINQIVVSYFEGAEGNAENREVFKYFGTFSRALFTMFEISLGNWAPPSRILVESVNEWFMFVTVLIKLTIGFAIVGVINGIFIQETLKVAETDDHLLLMQKERAESSHIKKMSKFFQMADTSRDGLMDRNEFVSMLQNDKVSMWLAAKGLDAASAADVDMVFSLLGHDREYLTPMDFAQGVAKLKGYARSVDLQILLRRHADTQRQCADLHMKMQELQDAIKAQHRESLKTAGV